MIYRIKLIIIVGLLQGLWGGKVAAQSADCVVPMQELVEIYDELNRAFPFSDYVTLKQSEVCYWVNRTMRPEYDFVGTMERLKPVIDKLKSLPCKNPPYTSDSQPAEGIVYACRPTFRDVSQDNYVELVFNRNKIHFYYTSKRRTTALKNEPNQQIANEMDELFWTFTKRPEVVSYGITFDGPTYQYQLVTFNNPQQIRQHAEGRIFTIPNCKVEDWMLIFNKMRGYALRYNVQVAWNDVYRDHESVEIWIDRESTVPIVFAATIKEGELKLLRLEGTKDFNIVLPRVWSEDSPIFNPKRNNDYE
ncbi:MAG: hypothetical protein IJS20_10190 [Bacteroidales bacterium]|nr:hypothetical protein [Bacteroidales bacterium]